MKTHLQQAGYVLHPATNTWSKPNYSGIAYSDGDETEQRIANLIDQASDVTVFSTELRQRCTDWPSLYYLSSLRSNILRPFESSITGDILEIGAGCGAITRYLGECGANILALEGSPRRAAIARSRTRDLDNVTVLTEKFDSFDVNLKFDVITLIGVLEYANLFTMGDNPTLSMLERVRSLLKPDGKLIIAIENQLGLKYFAGAPEDHVGQPMYGVEGRYSKNDPQTFGRKALSDILAQADFAAVEFLAPFPDYKLPVSIITSEGLINKHFDAGALAWQSANRDPQLPLYRNFSLELVWPEIFNNQFALDVSNSFLIVATPHAVRLSEPNVLAYHYSTDRAPQFCKETKFVQSASADINVIYTNLNKTNDLGRVNENHLISHHYPPSVQYSVGKPLSIEFLKTVTRDNWSITEVADFLKRYISILADLSNQPELKNTNIQPDACLPGWCFDLVPQNIILKDDGEIEAIDTEWTLGTSIEIGHLLFRSLLLMISSVTRFGTFEGDSTFTRLTFVQSALASIGLKLKKDAFSRYIDLESRIQEQITGRSAREFLDWHPEQPLPTKNVNHALIDRDRTIHSLNQEIFTLKAATANQAQVIAERESQIHQLIGSKSWLFTKPIRWANRIARGDFSMSLAPFRRRLRSQSLVGISPSTAATPTTWNHLGTNSEPIYLAPITPTHSVCVILPIYSGVNMTKRCILAAMPDVLATPNAVLLAINDSSPDAGMQEMLEELASQWPDKLVVLKNHVNLGFVGTVNRGLHYFPQFDALLLNSDVIVPNDWLHRLINEAYSSPKIATVTPFSNNATICSFPNSLQENAQPLNLSVDQIDSVFKKSHLPCVEAPTGVGFCMYIRRACLNEIGTLNEEKFGKGYGEENDLCQRALKKGWLNIISPNLYAYHEGGISFSTGKQALVDRATRVIEELHPNYHRDVQAFIVADPLKQARITRFADLLATTPLPKVLHISHGLGGGVDQHITELAEYLKHRVNSFILTPQLGGKRLTLRLNHQNGADGLAIVLPENYQDLTTLLRCLNVQAIHFHHAINIDPLLYQLPEDLGIPHYLTIHDYYLLNGNPTLTDKNGVFSTEAIDVHNPLYPLPKDMTPNLWREQHRKHVETATHVIFPSVATKNLFGGAYQAKRFVVAYHVEAGRDVYRQPKVFSRKNKYTIGILGALSREKGADYLEELAEAAKKAGIPVSFTLIGYAHRQLNTVKVTGAYQSHDLPDLLEEHDCDLIFFPARCPETYSYTLSSAIESGLPIVAPSFGAFPERLAGRKHVMLFEHDASVSVLLQNLMSFIEALETGLPCSAPQSTDEVVDAKYYDSHYLDNLQDRRISIPDGNDAVRHQVIEKLLLNPDNENRTLKETTLYLVWKIYNRPSMRWIDSIIPYHVRRGIKHSLSSRPMHEVVGKTSQK